jgi:primosomal protein N' (replication factor Y)
VIQTYQPDHYAVRHAARQDFEAFYEEEIAYRRLLRYPPAAHMMAVQIQSEDEEAALHAANEIRLRLMEEQNPAGGIPGSMRARGQSPAGGIPGSMRARGQVPAGVTRGSGVTPEQNLTGERPGGGHVFQVIGPSGASLKKLRDMFRFVLYIKSEKYDTLVCCKDIIEAMTSAAGKAGGGKNGDTRFRNVDIQFDFDPINAF